MKPTHSYHIMKNLAGQVWTFWWPMSSFGDYCTSEKRARAEFVKQKDGGYRLVRYPAVTNCGMVASLASQESLKF